ncbi:MAG: small multi-drug export protein [Bacillota bacterium]|nr:small multi-drug export protein [Bacillota bacterium]
MKDSIIEFLESIFGNAHALIILIGSAIPITEQRATIPLGIYWDMNPWYVFFLAFIGSLLPVPILLLLYTKILALMARITWLSWLTRAIDQKVRRYAQRFEKSTEVALIIFVSIPLPGTGLWTGSMVASLLGFKFVKSFICVTLGALLSAIGLTLVFSLIRYGFTLF